MAEVTCRIFCFGSTHTGIKFPSTPSRPKGTPQPLFGIFHPPLMNSTVLGWEDGSRKPSLGTCKPLNSRGTKCIHSVERHKICRVQTPMHANFLKLEVLINADSHKKQEPRPGHVFFPSPPPLSMPRDCTKYMLVLSFYSLLKVDWLQ